MATYIFLNERDAAPPSEQPLVRLDRWRLLQAPNGDQHLVAELPNGALRITSAIAASDAPSRSLTTSSGRRYLLDAPPTSDLVVLGKLAANAVRSGLGDAIDISEQTWVDLLAVEPSATGADEQATQPQSGG